VSDGGEAQGADEEALWGMRKAKNHHVQFWKEPSRASGSLLSDLGPEKRDWKLPSATIASHRISDGGSLLCFPAPVSPLTST